MAETTKKHFKTFKKAIRHYYKKYRLHGWHVYYDHVEHDSLASTFADIDTKVKYKAFGKAITACSKA